MKKNQNEQKPVNDGLESRIKQKRSDDLTHKSSIINDNIIKFCNNDESEIIKKQQQKNDGFQKDHILAKHYRNKQNQVLDVDFKQSGQQLRLSSKDVDVNDLINSSKSRQNFIIRSNSNQDDNKKSSSYKDQLQLRLNFAEIQEEEFRELIHQKKRRGMTLQTIQRPRTARDESKTHNLLPEDRSSRRKINDNGIDIQLDQVEYDDQKDFLQILRHQMVHLQERLKIEIRHKLALIKHTSNLKKELWAVKQILAKQLKSNQGMQQTPVAIGLDLPDAIKNIYSQQKQFVSCQTQTDPVALDLGAYERDLKAASDVVWRDEDIKIQIKDGKSILSDELSNIEPNETQNDPMTGIKTLNQDEFQFDEVIVSGNSTIVSGNINNIQHRTDHGSILNEQAGEKVSKTFSSSLSKPYIRFGTRSGKLGSMSSLFRAKAKTRPPSPHRDNGINVIVENLNETQSQIDELIDQEDLTEDGGQDKQNSKNQRNFAINLDLVTQKIERIKEKEEQDGQIYRFQRPRKNSNARQPHSSGISAQGSKPSYQVLEEDERKKLQKQWRSKMVQQHREIAHFDNLGKSQDHSKSKKYLHSSMSMAVNSGYKNAMNRLQLSSYFKNSQIQDNSGNDRGGSFTQLNQQNQENSLTLSAHPLLNDNKFGRKRLLHVSSMRGSLNGVEKPDKDYKFMFNLLLEEKKRQVKNTKELIDKIHVLTEEIKLLKQKNKQLSVVVNRFSNLPDHCEFQIQDANHNSSTSSLFLNKNNQNIQNKFVQEQYNEIINEQSITPQNQQDIPKSQLVSITNSENQQVTNNQQKYSLAQQYQQQTTDDSIRPSQLTNANNRSKASISLNECLFTRSEKELQLVRERQAQNNQQNQQKPPSPNDIASRMRQRLSKNKSSFKQQQNQQLLDANLQGNQQKSQTFVDKRSKQNQNIDLDGQIPRVESTGSYVFSQNNSINVMVEEHYFVEKPVIENDPDHQKSSPYIPTPQVIQKKGHHQRHRSNQTLQNNYNTTQLPEHHNQQINNMNGKDNSRMPAAAYLTKSLAAPPTLLNPLTCPSPHDQLQLPDDSLPSPASHSNTVHFSEPMLHKSAHVLDKQNSITSPVAADKKKKRGTESRKSSVSKDKKSKKSNKTKTKDKNLTKSHPHEDPLPEPQSTSGSGFMSLLKKKLMRSGNKDINKFESKKDAKKRQSLAQNTDIDQKLMMTRPSAVSVSVHHSARKSNNKDSYNRAKSVGIRHQEKNNQNNSKSVVVDTAIYNTTDNRHQSHIPLEDGVSEVDDDNSLRLRAQRSEQLFQRNNTINVQYLDFQKQSSMIEMRNNDMQRSETYQQSDNLDLILDDGSLNKPQNYNQTILGHNLRIDTENLDDQYQIQDHIQQQFNTEGNFNKPRSSVITGDPQSGFFISSPIKKSSLTNEQILLQGQQDRSNSSRIIHQNYSSNPNPQRLTDLPDLQGGAREMTFMGQQQVSQPYNYQSTPVHHPDSNQIIHNLYQTNISIQNGTFNNTQFIGSTPAQQHPATPFSHANFSSGVPLQQRFMDLSAAQQPGRSHIQGNQMQDLGSHSGFWELNQQASQSQNSINFTGHGGKAGIEFREGQNSQGQQFGNMSQLRKERGSANAKNSQPEQATNQQIQGNSSGNQCHQQYRKQEMGGYKYL